MAVLIAVVSTLSSPMIALFCSKLTSINLQNFSTENVSNMNNIENKQLLNNGNNIWHLSCNTHSLIFGFNTVYYHDGAWTFSQKKIPQNGHFSAICRNYTGKKRKPGNRGFRR